MTARVCVVGLGYIGLPTGALLANSGFEVHGVDVNSANVDTINDGRVHIVEPDLDELVRDVVAKGALKASTVPAEADVFMLCVPTPFRDVDGDPQPNLDFVIEASRAIAPFVKPGNLVILESTSPVGATELVARTLQDEGVDTAGLSIAYCPERVLPGKILKELVENDRIVGGLDDAAANKVGEFYERFVTGKVLKTDARTAEMCKLTENSFRDVNIAFANELSLICDKLGIDVWELISLANCHPRVEILQPGPGVGGHCIAVDPWFIVASDPEQARLIRQARDVNDGKPRWVVNRVLDTIENLHGKRVACLGLAFKPDIDDLRESPALQIVRELRGKGVDTINVEPNIDTHADLPLSSLDEALDQADLVVILVRHRQFLTEEFAAKLKGKAVFDVCGALKA